MKLIGSHTSPFVRKTRIVLAEKRIEYEFVVENPARSGLAGGRVQSAREGARAGHR